MMVCVNVTGLLVVTHAIHIRDKASFTPEHFVARDSATKRSDINHFLWLLLALRCVQALGNH